MPAAWQLPSSGAQWGVQDVERFNKLPFYMARQQTVQIPYWSRYKDIFAKIKWKTNLGDTLVGVVSEYSPKTTQVMKPNFITSTPLKTVASHFERSNTARIYRHKFESPQFNWLSSFRDFQTGQLAFASKDLNRQIAFGYDDFVRWQIIQISPAVYAVGADVPYITNVPVGPPGEGILVDPKTTGVFAAIIAQIGQDGYLDFRNICALRSHARNTMGMVPWDGAPEAPGDNSILTGNFLLMGDPCIYEAMQFDEHALNVRPLAMDLLHKGWTGVIADNIIFRAERYDLRFLADGTLPAPEIEVVYGANGTITSGSSEITNPGGAARIEVLPNPAYTSAPFGCALFMGHQPYESIDIGPPPSEFASAKLDTTRLSKMNWNGEVMLTDNLLINYGGASGLSIETMDTNKYGEFLQLIAQVVLGIIPKTSRFAVPVFYRRNIAPSLKSAV